MKENELEKKTILIVEENCTNMRVIEEILCDTYILLTASSFQAALDIINNAVEYNSVSVVITDTFMLAKDGYELIRRMRADKTMRLIPIIAVDGNPSEETEAHVLSLGANDYISKPYEEEIIKYRIANIIRLHEISALVNTFQYDSLTGLYSGEYFYAYVDKMLKNNPTQKYDVICCNIEQIKLINDLYGIIIGDDILKNCARAIMEVVGNNGFCGRIGSDRFAFFVEHTADFDSLYLDKINKEFNKFNPDLSIVIRYGICMANGSGISANSLCDRANFAISSIEGRYDVYYKVYDNSIRQRLINEQFIVSNMKKALDENQFEVYFQPKYDIKTEQIVGAEALVRWNSPQKGFMSPGQFIPFFEKNGFITELDIFVWRTCCKKIRSWIDAGNEAIPISVNVSRMDIYNHDVDKILISLIEEYNLTPQYIYLEITESAYTENPKQLIETVKKLKRHGFLIEMDDFGSGYSSLNMLSDLPIDVLKLDMGFLQNHEQESKRNILSFIISLAKWLHLGIVAEGVETTEHISLLRSLNCDCAQGFYFAEPMCDVDFGKLLTKHSGYAPASELKTSFKRSEMQFYHAETIIYIGKNDDDEKLFKNIFSHCYMVIRCLDVDSMLKNESVITSDIVAVIYDIDCDKNVNKLKNITNMLSMPVISLNSSYEDAISSINAGAVDYIIKPFVNSAIKNRIEAIILNSQLLKKQKDSKLQFAIEEMKNRAEHDSLTGLLNRAEFKNRVENITKNNIVNEGFFIMIDIDNFKYINDTYGHYVGDDVLHSIGHIIRGLFGQNDMTGRLGGDEFAIFIPRKANKKEMIICIEKLCSKLQFSVETMPVSCSIGISIYPQHGDTFQALYENADIALLYAKRNGKKQYKIYEKDMVVECDERLETRAASLLDGVSDAMFVCNAVTNEIIYINDTACGLIGETKDFCLGRKCYQILWERDTNCDRCNSIGECEKCFYYEETLLNDGKTKIHIKAKTDTWDGRKVKIHYLTLI